MQPLEAGLQRAGVKQERSSRCHGGARPRECGAHDDPVGRSVPQQTEVSEDVEPRL